MGKQLVNFITCGCESSGPFFVIYKVGHEPTPFGDRETLDLEKELDKQLLELKQTNNDEELVQHEKYVDLNEKIYEMQNTGELYTNSKACIK
jgi:hypothetical protein